MFLPNMLAEFNMATSSKAALSLFLYIFAHVHPKLKRGLVYPQSTDMPKIELRQVIRSVSWIVSPRNPFSYLFAELPAAA